MIVPNSIIHGDCLEVMKDIDDNSIDMVLTSPPYDNLRTYNGSLEWGEHVWKPVIDELYRVVKDGGVVVWVVGDATIKGSETGTSFKQALYFKDVGFNIHDTMIYEKKNISFPESVRYYNAFEYMFIFSKGKNKTFNPITKPNPLAGKIMRPTKRGKDGVLLKDSGYLKPYPDVSVLRNVWRYATGTASSTDRLARNHPAIFPEQLANDHIFTWSNEGDTILDPFAGSGTTGKMAILNNRKYILIEKEETYFEICKQRTAEAMAKFNNTQQRLTDFSFDITKNS